MPPNNNTAQPPLTPNVEARPAARKVRVRTYRHGLGDCHLLSFTKPDGSLFHMLIDCGVVDLTKDPRPLMTAVADDIAKETGRTLDVVVATHQHTDHLSGFQQAAAAFQPVKMERLWLAWTEDKTNPLARKIQRQLLNKLAAVREAAARLSSLKGEAANAAARIQGVLDFFGPAGPAAQGAETQAILDALHAKSISPPVYHKPGAVFLLPEVPNVRVYVLGPPTDPVALKVTDPRKTKHEGYEAALAPAADGFVDALLPALGEGDPELNFPFDQRRRLTNAQAQADAFFQRHYFGPDVEAGEDQAWRRIDSAWLEIAEQLALFLDDYTNNTSLALAFEFIDTGDVLLFPGDAQIGSWLTWHKLAWTIKDPDGSKRRVRVGDLFARTVFYKAAHHASHNGTLSGLGADQTGLEQMTHRDLVCVVPVDREMAKKKRWDRTLPWSPLLRELTAKTRGRLVLTDANEPPPDPKKLSSLSAVEQNRFARSVVVTPKWVEYTL